MAIWDQFARDNAQSLARLNQSLTNDQLASILQQAAEEGEELAERIAQQGSIGARTRAAQLRMASSGGQAIADQLWDRAGKEIVGSIRDSTMLAQTHVLDLDALVGMPPEILESLGVGARQRAMRTAEAIINRRRYGYTLSERVYRNATATRQTVQRLIDQGLAQNLSARELAGSVRKFIDPRTRGGASYAAMRLARTEINNAYHWTTRERYASRPWVDRVAWKLSNSHPRNDVCDSLEMRGPYPPKDVPDKPHPHCLCYTAPETPDTDEFLKRLGNGDYDSWAADQGLSQRPSLTLV